MNDEIRGRVSLSIFDAGGCGPLCQLTALAAVMLVDPPDRRPRGRQMTAGMSEAAGMLHVLEVAELTLDVLCYALHAGRSPTAIAHDGVDPVGRAVLNAGGHIAVQQFLAATRTGSVPAAILLHNINCEVMGRHVLELLRLRPAVQ